MGVGSKRDGGCLAGSNFYTKASFRPSSIHLGFKPTPKAIISNFRHRYLVNIRVQAVI